MVCETLCAPYGLTNWFMLVLQSLAKCRIEVSQKSNVMSAHFEQIVRMSIIAIRFKYQIIELKSRFKHRFSNDNCRDRCLKVNLENLSIGNDPDQFFHCKDLYWLN